MQWDFISLSFSSLTPAIAIFQMHHGTKEQELAAAVLP